MFHEKWQAFTKKQELVVQHWRLNGSWEVFPQKSLCTPSSFTAKNSIPIISSEVKLTVWQTYQTASIINIFGRKITIIKMTFQISSYPRLVILRMHNLSARKKLNRKPGPGFNKKNINNRKNILWNQNHDLQTLSNAFIQE